MQKIPLIASALLASATLMVAEMHYTRELIPSEPPSQTPLKVSEIDAIIGNAPNEFKFTKPVAIEIVMAAESIASGVGEAACGIPYGLISKTKSDCHTPKTPKD